jgi:hypothetical protein
MENYRPISILSVLSKIIETIVKSGLVDFVDRHAIFYARQYGFRHDSNTEAALFDFVAHTQQLVEQILKIGMMFYELSKAFDTVNIKILLEKLAAIGILGDDLHWFKRYLTDRTQYTDVNGHSIKSLALKDVPYLYADYIAILYSSNKYEELNIKMEDDLQLLTN